MLSDVARDLNVGLSFCLCCYFMCVSNKGKRELVALLSLCSWCLVIVVCLFLAVSWICLQFVIVVFPERTHLLFLVSLSICAGSPEPLLLGYAKMAFYMTYKS